MRWRRCTSVDVVDEVDVVDAVDEVDWVDGLCAGRMPSF